MLTITATQLLALFKQKIRRRNPVTIISVHITDKTLLAVADGLISNNSPARVLAEDRKILIFEPRYKVPRVGLGRFNYFSEYSTGNFGIGYAGNLSLISTTVNAFQEAVRNCMFLDRDYNNGGKPQIYRQRNFEERLKSKRYNDSYNFQPDELPPITVSLLANILFKICEKTCLDFSRNAMKNPEMQFLVFGNESKGNSLRVRCEVLRILGFGSGNLQFQRFSVLPNEVAMIGDEKAIDSLMAIIDSDSKFKTQPSEFEGSIPQETSSTWGLLEPFDILNFELRGKRERNFETWAWLRSQVMKLHTLTLIEKETNTIGGDCTLAEIGFAKPLFLSVVPKFQLNGEIAHLKQEIT